MKTNKARQIIAIIALVFMAIATVTIIMVLFKRSLVDGVVGWLALVSSLLGVGLFLVVKFVLKEKPEPPAYLPKDAESDTATQPSEKADGADAEDAEQTQEDSQQ